VSALAAGIGHVLLVIGGLLARHLLASAALIAAYCLRVLISPHKRCGRCKGTRVARHLLTRRLRRCGRCKGYGKHQRLGARALHRLRWHVTSEIAALRERRSAAREEEQA